MLFRINAQSEAYEEALTEAAVPVRRARWRAVLRARRGAPGDGRGPRGRAGAGRVAAAGRRARALAPVGSPPRRRRGRARERWESLVALVELAEELVGVEPAADLRRFAELDSRADAAHAPTVEGVTLASLHAAKGLEWDAVFLVGLVDGTLPIQHADATTHAIEEERRLLYVGITRARQ